MSLTWLKWISNVNILFAYAFYVREPFAKLVDSPYYSESKLCGGEVTVSFSKHLPWQAMHFLQHSTHFSKTCCRPLITSKFLASERPFHGWKRNRMAWDLNWILCLAWKKWIGWTPLEHPPYSPDLSLPHAVSGLRKRDRNLISTKFRFGVIRWVHELFKRPSHLCCTELTSLNTTLWSRMTERMYSSTNS
jgi:hypothetical protein